MRHTLRNIALGGPTVALLLVSAAVQRGHAYPGDVFVTGAPVKGPAIHKATEVPTGTYSVSTETGAAGYSFPIAVPPGRNGMQPSLALTYSSQNPLRGGVAAGWSLPIPSIELDTSQGILGERFYRSSLSGNQRLIPVEEPALGSTPGGYRAESDPEFIRYQRYVSSCTPGTIHNCTVKPLWVALHPDGTVYLFGHEDNSFEVDADGAEVRLMLTRVLDPFGNEVKYNYERAYGAAQNGQVTNVPVDIMLASIEYGQNANANTVAHARVEFQYTDDMPPCPGSNVPPGAAFTYRNGVRSYRGYWPLQQIQVLSRSSAAASFTLRRKIELAYADSSRDCTKPRAPLRLLEAISEKVYDPTGGNEQPLPTISFGTARPAERSARQGSSSQLPSRRTARQARPTWAGARGTSIRTIPAAGLPSAPCSLTSMATASLT